MIYIKKVELNNFQSHDYTEMRFDRGLNVILGNSDVGKTAILRAIKWALYNEPKGDYFIRQGERDVSVKVVFSNGVVVQRKKTPSKNSYYLLDTSGNERLFEGFGVDVPKEISDITNMYKVTLDSSNSKVILNIAEQLDGPFLLNEQPSFRASAIGRLLGVNYLDDALRSVVKDNKRIRQDIDSLNLSKKELENKIKEFEYIENYKLKYEKILKIRNNIYELQSRLENVSHLKKVYNTNKSEIKEIVNLINKLKNLENIDLIYEKLKVYTLKKNNFENLLYKYNNTDTEIISVKNDLNKLKNLEKYSDVIHAINRKKDNLALYESLNKTFTKISKSIYKTNTEIENFKNAEKIENLIKKIETNLNEYYLIHNNSENLKKIQTSLDCGKEYIKNFTNNEALDEIFQKITANVLLLNSLEKLLNDLDNKSIEIERERKTINKLNYDIKNNTDIYEKTILDLGVCPFCYSTITKDSAQHIKNHLRND